MLVYFLPFPVLGPNFLPASVFGVSYTLWWEVGDGMWDQFEEPGGVFSWLLINYQLSSSPNY